MFEFGHDRTSGVIIGEQGYTVQLISPKGSVEAEDIIERPDTVKAWGERKKAQILSMPCGDGKPLSAHPNIIKSIYGDGDWTVREYD